MSDFKFNTAVVYPFRPTAVSMGRRNRDYWDLTDAQLAEKYPDDKRVWAYSFPRVPCDLIPEPDNPDDPNAVKIILDGQQIGYVPHLLCAEVLAILKRPHEIRGSITSGPHKSVTSGDVRHFDDPFDIRVTITYDGAPVQATRSARRRGGKVSAPVVLQWISAACLLIVGLAALPAFSGFLFILAAILAAPVRPLRELLARYHVRPWMIGAAAAVLTILAFAFFRGSAV